MNPDSLQPCLTVSIISSLTYTVAESASVPEIREQLSPADVVEQHVDTGVVVRPPPPATNHNTTN